MKFITHASIASAVLLFGALIFQWDIIDILTPFLGPFVLLAAWCVYIVVLLISIVFALARRSAPKDERVRMVIVNLAVGLVAFFTPFTQLVLHADFALNLARRAEVVR